MPVLTLHSTLFASLPQVINIEFVPSRALTEYIVCVPSTGRNPTRDRSHSHLLPLDYDTMKGERSVIVEDKGLEAKHARRDGGAHG